MTKRAKVQPAIRGTFTDGRPSKERPPTGGGGSHRYGVRSRGRARGDPVRTGKHRNLSIKVIPILCEASLKVHIQSHVDRAVEAAGFARDHRNRRIAHLDYDLALGREPEPLPAGSLEKAELSLDSIHAVLDTVYVQTSGSRIDNLAKAVVPGVEALLAYTRQMAAAVVYIDSVIDLGGELPQTDHAAAAEFLRKLGRPPTEVDDVMELREAAKRLKGLT